MIDRIRQLLQYYLTLALLYGATAFVAVCALRPTSLPQALSPQRVVASPETPRATPKATTKNTVISGRPTRLTIPALSIDLPVDKGYHDPESGSWTLSDTRAQFALPSSLANTKQGTTLIYGHNNRQVFAPIYRLQAEDRAEVYTDNGYVFQYTYHRYDTVKPDNVTIFTNEGSPRLTLQTCSGNWDGLRRLHHFTLHNVKKLT